MDTHPVNKNQKSFREPPRALVATPASGRLSMTAPAARGLTFNRCTQCGKSFPASLEYFPSAKEKRDGLSSWCRACHRTNDARYRRIHREARRAHDSKYFADHPEAARAKTIVKRAIGTGRLERPEHCSKCGRSCKPDFHHPDYSRPLDVVALCRRCHKAVHVEAKALRKLRNVLSKEPHDG